MLAPNVAQAKTESQYVGFSGGMDTSSQRLSVPAGMVRQAKNYLPLVTGGYRRIGGYERYSGLPRPSDADYLLVATASSASVGDVVVGSVSAATGVVCYVDPAFIALTKASGSFELDEQLLVSGSPVGVVTLDPVSVSGTLNNTLSAAAANVYRADIGPVPGTGPILGLLVLNAEVFAVRSNGSNAIFHKATAGGWVEVTTPALAPGGRFRFDTGAIVGTPVKAYGCDGVNPEFEFDGVTMTPIDTGMAPLRAQCVRVHQKHLFFAYQNSLQNSSIADPHTWSAVTGAAELNALSAITNLLPLSGGDQAASLLVISERRSMVLYGTSAADWKMVTLSIESGAAPDSAQELSGALVASRSGVRNIRSDAAFSNFSYELATNRIAGFLDKRTITDSTVFKVDNQYWVFFDTGEALVGGPQKKEFQWMPADLGRPALMVARGLFSGAERHFFGSSDGYVYEMNVGRSFDGDVIPAYLNTHPFVAKSPWTIKQWRQALLEVVGESTCTIRLQAMHDYGSPEKTDSDALYLEAQPSGAVWDSEAAWDESTWDGAYSGNLVYRCYGVSSAVEFSIFSSSDNEKPHVIHGSSVTFTPRRGAR